VLPATPADRPFSELDERPLGPPPPSAPRQVPAHLRKLGELLNSSDGIKAAFLLTEILGPPRCRRPKRGLT
jgi:hypothetical protein